MQSIRQTMPLTFAVLFLVLAIRQLTTTLSSGAWRNPSAEMATKWEERLQVLREAVPSDVHIAGYVDDSFLSGDPSKLDVNEFQLMQYSIAPVAIQYGTGYEWIIGNFSDDEVLEARLTEELGPYEIQGFGFGLYLIRDVEN
jgi:hypothetical protein